MGFDWLSYGMGVATPILIQILAAILFFKLKFRKIKKNRYIVNQEEESRINKIVKEVK